MEWIYITFRSITVAQRAGRILEQVGIETTMTRARRWMVQRGCSYALRLRKIQAAAAAEALKQGEIPWTGAYLPDGKGGGTAYDLPR